jgi:hypothetical protein
LGLGLGGGRLEKLSVVLALRLWEVVVEIESEAVEGLLRGGRG